MIKKDSWYVHKCQETNIFLLLAEHTFHKISLEIADWCVKIINVYTKIFILYIHNQGNNYIKNCNI